MRVRESGSAVTRKAQMQIPIQSPLLSLLSIVGILAASPLIYAANPAHPASDDGVDQQLREHQVRVHYGNLALSFEANQGQVDEGVRFLARGDGYSLFLTESGAILALDAKSSCSRRVRPSGLDTMRPGDKCTPTQDLVRIRMSAATGNSLAVMKRSGVFGENELAGTVNYFLGNDPSRWHAGIHTFAKVRYSELYPGIDLVYYGNQHQLEYDFVVAPGANPAAIQMKLDAESPVRLRVKANGDLAVIGTHGQVVLHKPLVYQESGDERHLVAASFRVLAGNTVAFRLGKYDVTRSLVIDPVLSYSTYLGGSGAVPSYGVPPGDYGSGIAVDSTGSAYVVGTTYSTDFPVTSLAYQTKPKIPASLGGSAVFISKLNATGTGLVYSTYLGGSGWGGNGDSGASIALDSENNAYLTGYTFSSDFPVTTGAYTSASSIPNLGYPNLFITKLNPSGTTLVYSATIGPGHGQGIAIDSAGDAFVAGETVFGSYPTTTGAYQSKTAGAFYNGFNTPNVVITKLNPTGTSLMYSTFLGGSGYTTYASGDFFAGDSGNAIAVDQAGNAYVTGNTSSSNFPVTAGAFQTSYDGAQAATLINTPNAFVSKLNAAGSALVYSTYLGGTGAPASIYDGVGIYGNGDQGFAIAVDSGGDAVVGGSTYSTNFPVTSGILSTLGSSNGAGFVTKLNAAGSGLAYSTYVGSSGASVTSLVLDSTDAAYLTGAAGTNFPLTPNALPSQGCCAFIAKMNPTGTGFAYATLLGGTGTAATSAVAIDSSLGVYVTGNTSETNFPTTPGAFQTVNNASKNATTNGFVTKISIPTQVSNYFATTTTGTLSSSLLGPGQLESLVVTVTSAAGGTVPTGSVILTPLIGSAAFPRTSLTLNSSGVAQGSSSTLPIGFYYLNVSYGGDATHLPSVTTVQFRVQGPPALIAVYQPYNGTYGQSSELILTVMDATGFPLQGVTVEFSGTNLQFSSPTAVTVAYGNVFEKVTASKAGTFAASVTAPGSKAASNFSMVFQQAYLNLTLKPVSRLYGAANPSSPYSLSGLVGADTVTVALQTTATATSPVGVYPVTATISGPDAANYNLGVNASTLTVVKAPLIVTGLEYYSTYGQTPTAPASYGLKGFVNGDTASVVTGAPVLSITATAKSAPGYYPITVAVGTLSATNYSFDPNNWQPGSLLISRAPITVTANSLTMTQGGSVPALTYALAGFVNGDTAGATVTGMPVLSTTATSSSKPGSYPIVITAGTLASPDYYFKPVNGVLTVTAP
jgi:hypothetical protein